MRYAVYEYKPNQAITFVKLLDLYILLILLENRMRIMEYEYIKPIAL